MMDRYSLQNLSELRQVLVEYFNQEELRNLCFELGVDYESLPGEGKSGKARELVAYFDRHGRLAELIVTCKRLRPNIPWAIQELPESLPGYKRKALEERLDSLLEEYEAASRQLRVSLDEIDRVRLRRQMMALESEIQSIEQEIRLLPDVSDHLPAKGRFDERENRLIQKAIDRANVEATLDDLKRIAPTQEAYKEVLVHFEKGLESAQRAGEERDVVAALSYVAGAYRTQGKLETSLECYQASLAIWHDVGDRVGEARTLYNIGGVYRAQGNTAEAWLCFQESLSIVRELGQRDMEANALQNLGSLLLAMGDSKAALGYFSQAETIWAGLEDKAGLFTTLRDKGLALLNLGEVGPARQEFERSLVISRETRNIADEVTALTNLGLVATQLADWEEAEKIYKKVLELQERLRNTAGLVAVLANLGSVCANLKRWDESLDYYQRGQTIARRVDDRASEVAALSNIGNVLTQKGDLEEALATYQQALDIQKQIGDMAGLVRTEEALSAIYRQREELEKPFLFLMSEAQRFFQVAGFELEMSVEETSFLCQPSDKLWQDRFSRPIPVKIISGTALDVDMVYALCQFAHKVLDSKPPVIFVVIDRTPTDSGWLQIGAMRAKGVQVIPIDDTVLFEGLEQGRQQQVLEKHLRRFLGTGRDLYNVRDPVADRLNFFGREVLATELMELLTEGRPVALFGLRKMGKSSLLKYLRDKFPFPTALVDLQAGVELNDLYERILTSWGHSMQVKLREVEWSPGNLSRVSDHSSAFTAATRQLLARLEDHNVPPRLCLLVDEIECIVPHDQKESLHGLLAMFRGFWARVVAREGGWYASDLDRYLAFARALRGLVQEEEGRFSLLVAGVDPSFNRVNRLDGQQNPFYQFFREVYLPSLDRDDCIQMIRNIGRQMGLVYADKAVDFVADVSGGHPFLARQLCSLALKSIDRQGEVSLPHLKETANRFIREPGTSALLNENGLWGEISSTALWPPSQIVENQAVLKLLAQTEPQLESELLRCAQDPQACEHSLTELEQRAVLDKLESLFNIRLRLFRNWIRRYQLKEG